jgi:hypothetical protein
LEIDHLRQTVIVVWVEILVEIIREGFFLVDVWAVRVDIIVVINESIVVVI